MSDQPKPPEWTPDRPTVGGWYWWAPDKSGSPRVVELFVLPGAQAYWQSRSGSVYDGQYPSGLWWSVPIPVPPPPWTD